MIYHIGKSGLEITVSNEQNDLIICNKEACETSSDPIAKKIYLAATEAFVFFRHKFNFFGIDGRGALPELVVHWDDPEMSPNANSLHHTKSCYRAKNVQSKTIGAMCTRIAKLRVTHFFSQQQHQLAHMIE